MTPTGISSIVPVHVGRSLSQKRSNLWSRPGIDLEVVVVEDGAREETAPGRRERDRAARLLADAAAAA